MTSKRAFIFLLIIGVLTAAFVPTTSVQAAMDKNAIISQDDVTYNNVTAAEIQQYLNTTGSQLATYTIPVEYEVYYPTGKGQWDKVTVKQEWQSNLELETYHGKTIAQMVADAATVNRSDRSPSSPGKINPVIALATLDKESASITGSYKTSIVDRPITMSWLMGYGFDGTMDNCIKNGVCNVDYNRQRAYWYGGPGQQIMEGTSALKRWIASPTPHSSCEGGTWNRMNINGECLNLQNSISYALYKYTPNFSGNELFLSLYNKIKAAFPFPALVPPNEADNDTGKYSQETYGNYFHLVGSKAPNNQAYFRDKLIADFGTTNWDFTFEPWPGKVDYSIDFKRADGSIINSKPFHINRRKVGDINDDGKVDLLDLSIMGNYWGHTDPPNPMTNIDGEAEVNILDLSLLAANFEG